jgi:hypothetical protein
MTINTSQNVGIGTASPNARLSFGTSANLNGIYLYDDGSGASGLGITSNTLNVYSGGTTIAFGTGQTSGSSSLVSPSMYIVNGNVGIGTASPNSLLTTLNNQLYTANESAKHGLQTLTGTTSADYTLYMGADKTNQVSYIQSVNWGIAKANLALNAAGGNVGIGTASPSTLLTLGANSGTNGAIAFNGSTSGTVTVQSAAVAGTWTMTLPTSAGSSGYLLSTNGSGVTSWVAATGGGSTVPTGGGTDAIFYNNGQTVNTSYTIPTGQNSGTFGPITIAAAATVTVPAGSTWSIV